MYRHSSSTIITTYSKALSLIWIISYCHRRALHIDTTNLSILFINLPFIIHPVICSTLPDISFLVAQYGFGHLHSCQFYHMQIASNQYLEMAVLANSLLIIFSSSHPRTLLCTIFLTYHLHRLITLKWFATNSQDLLTFITHIHTGFGQSIPSDQSRSV